MRVKVIRASKDTYWYAEHIGDIFEVNNAPKWLYFSDENSIYAYTVAYDEHSSFIEFMDCIELPISAEGSPLNKCKYIVTYDQNEFFTYDEAVRKAKKFLEERPDVQLTIYKAISFVEAENSTSTIKVKRIGD